MRFAPLPGLLSVALLALACHDLTGPDPETISSPRFSHAGTGAGFHGSGSVGTGAATPGSSRQDFEIDLAADLRTSTLRYTDWSIVRPDGNPVTVVVSATDYYAGIVTFRDGSAACTDPSRGAEFAGWARLDGGGLVPFTVAACDNGAAGSGADFFRITLPNSGYQQQGPVASGDVVKTGALPPPANPQVRGLGWFPPGRPTPESYGKQFDFEATAAPSGRLAYTDHQAIRPDGSRGGFTVNSATDPATGVTSYQQLSSTCVRFGGTGRIDTGELSPFWIDVCDNASPGTGSDTFEISVPNLFKLGGTLTDGDIVLGAAAPSTGDLSVTATTTGESLDSDGYTATVDGTTSQPLATNDGRVTFTGLSAGSHTVVLSGVATNCTVTGGNSQPVSVTAGETASAAFSVRCAALTGDLRVTATTTGGTHDSDGYTVTVDGSTGQHLPTNGGSVTFTGLSAGEHTVALSGVAAHCTVTDGASRPISVPAGGTASTAFAVTCAQLTGNLTVKVSTSGVSLDPDGYMVTLDGSNPRTVAINGSTTYTSLPNGNYAVSISGLAANCKTSGENTRIVAVPAGETATTSFSITCEPGPATQLRFTVQPSDTKVNSTIQPPVQVTALDAQGNRATSFNGSVTIAIGRNGGGLLPGTLSGTRTVSAVNGVATFSDLRIDRAGDYTLRVTSSGLAGAESQLFRIQNLVCVLAVCL